MFLSFFAVGFYLSRTHSRLCMSKHTHAHSRSGHTIAVQTLCKHLQAKKKALHWIAQLHLPGQFEHHESMHKCPCRLSCCYSLLFTHELCCYCNHWCCHCTSCRRGRFLYRGTSKEEQI